MDGVFQHGTPARWFISNFWLCRYGSGEPYPARLRDGHVRLPGSGAAPRGGPLRQGRRLLVRNHPVGDAQPHTGLRRAESTRGHIRRGGVRTEAGVGRAGTGESGGGGTGVRGRGRGGAVLPGSDAGVLGGWRPWPALSAGSRRRALPVECVLLNVHGFCDGRSGHFTSAVSTFKCTAVTRRPPLPDNGHIRSLQPNSSPTVSRSNYAATRLGRVKRCKRNSIVIKWVLVVAELLT